MYEHKSKIVNQTNISLKTRDIITPNEYRQDRQDWHNKAKISAKFRGILDKMVLENCDQRYQSAGEILNVL